MEYTIQDPGPLCRVMLRGAFTFSDNRSFRSLMRLLNQAPQSIELAIELDFSGVDFVDSDALGMLLQLRDQADMQSVPVILRQPAGQVQEMFKLSKFDQLFSITP